MSEEVKQEEVEETNPLINILNQMVDDAEFLEEDGRSAMERNVGVSAEYVQDFCHAVVGELMNAKSANEGAMILDVEDLLLLVAIGLETGSRHMKERAQ